MKVRAILFDAGDTLFRVRGSVGDVYATVAARHGVTVAPAEIEQRFRAAFRRMPPLAFPGTADTDLPAREYGWWRQLVTAVFQGQRFADFDAFFGELFDYFARPESWELFDDVIPTLDALRAGGLRVGMVSNFDCRLLRICDGLGIARRFGAIVMSGHAGAAKPDPGIFATALALLGVHPTEVVHVGDSVREDIDGARAAGVRGLLLARTAGAGGPDVIHSLRDVMEACGLGTEHR
jgi:putative hydrolase of the HAD superfamily